MIPKKENWRDNCHHCPYFDQCQSSKSAEECKAFLDKEMMKNMIKALQKNKRHVWQIAKKYFQILVCTLVCFPNDCSESRLLEMEISFPWLGKTLVETYFTLR